MPFKFSNCICLCTPEHESAVKFYRDVVGLEVAGEDDSMVEFKAEQNRLFVDKSEAHGGIALGMVLELEVHNLEEARKELEEAGCEVVRFEGKGRDCYMRDPFGGIFNLWENPKAFDK